MNNKYIEDNYDIAIIGLGHAGCEAALACARMGMKTLGLTINLDGIALMACNPAIGGTSKGHLVREVDALGGEMGKVIDKTLLQIRMLNTSKGPAVHSLRAQADKKKYQALMKLTMETTDNLDIRQGECTRVIMDGNTVTGVELDDGTLFGCKAVVMATGVYLKSRIIIGEYSANAGPSGLFPANKLSADLIEHGIRLMRFKTGTPARVDKRTIDFSKMTVQDGEENIMPFSFENQPFNQSQTPCYLTWTNEKTHDIIRENLERSPLFSGDIDGTGPRYCPSIEDKVVRFADKLRHQVFIEPEGSDTMEMYVQGMSTSLPIDVQARMLRTIEGLENVRIMRPGYAIEYDCIDPVQLGSNLSIKGMEGMYFAGQINGSSGYEEAAAQGLIAGVNATLYLQDKEPIVLGRDEAYAGVLIDDLVTKGTREPYRMMTSRAEYRLLLRQDNADDRLTKIGYDLGLISQERYDGLLKQQEQVAELQNLTEKTILQNSDDLEAILSGCREKLPKSNSSIADLVRRPPVKLKPLMEHVGLTAEDAVINKVEINIKYSGYLIKQQKEVERYKRMENRKIPDDMVFGDIPGLRIEAAQKLEQVKPASIGQAGRISGVSPADITVLMIWLEKV